MKNWLTNGAGLIGSYGVSLAEFTNAVPLPQWFGIVSAGAGVFLTFSLASIRMAEARKRMAQAKRLEIENNILLQDGEHGKQD